MQCPQIQTNTQTNKHTNNMFEPDVVKGVFLIKDKVY